MGVCVCACVCVFGVYLSLWLNFLSISICMWNDGYVFSLAVGWS